MKKCPDNTSLYRPEFERDSCGFGLIAHRSGQASHWVVETAITALERMTHRGAVAADGKSGDGCGLLLKVGREFLVEVAAECGLEVSGRFAVGMVLLNTDPDKAQRIRSVLEGHLADVGLRSAGWRAVPIDSTVCGDEALSSLPRIEQIFVNAPASLMDDELERRLYIARRRTETEMHHVDEMFNVVSLSALTIGYKGLVTPENLPRFYPDLLDHRLTASIAVFHQRFSTNTWPQWRLAQPFRLLAHNGEINTVRGNRNWARARSSVFKSPLLPDLNEFDPIVSMSGSDSFSLDNMLEILLAGGMDVMQAMRLLLPPAWQTVTTIDPELRAFYEYYGMHMEAWDGPAGIVLSDGRYAVCALDRNGLRPARWVHTNDDHITISSEIGVFDYSEADVLAKGKLGPGDILVVDTLTGRLLDTEAIDNDLKQRAPFRKWLKQGVRYLDSRLVDQRTIEQPMDSERVRIYEKLFGVSTEERNEVLKVLANIEAEAVGSMGDDTPVAVMSEKVRSLYDYFRQQFAQVTNPPIDPLRERLVMSLETQIGAEKNIFQMRADHAQRIVISSPILSERKFHQILEEGADYPSATIDLNYPTDDETLAQAIDRIC